MYSGNHLSVYLVVVEFYYCRPGTVSVLDTLRHERRTVRGLYRGSFQGILGTNDIARARLFMI